MAKKDQCLKLMKVIPFLCLVSFAFGVFAQKQEVKLWFKRPAVDWNEALPVGNGRLGAMVFGGVDHERLQLNEETVWTKGGVYVDKKEGYKAIPGIRKLLFDGKYVEAQKMCQGYLEPIIPKNYQQILDDHIAEYRNWFNRVSLELPCSEAAGFATDERIDARKRGVYDPSLTALYFQFGRYLLISSSRPGCMPANLQGIWAQGLTPPWNSDYHININIQMNYWPSEVTNLSECHIPFLEFIGGLREKGSKTAKEVYGLNGFTAHHTTDAWQFTSPFGNPRYGMWPMGAAWASTHMWEHFLFTGDKEFLREYGYPVMREAALFLSEFMVQHPETGKWITGPSMSPENVFLTPENEKASVCMGPAMDLQVVWHLFTSCIKASEVLDEDYAFREKLKDQLANLTPVKIGDDGCILEWTLEDLREALPGHRHMSHLYGLYPSFQYNWNDTPQYMKASARVLEERLKHGGGHTGWSRAWMINFYARLLDSQNVWKNLVAFS